MCCAGYQGSQIWSLLLGGTEPSSGSPPMYPRDLHRPVWFLLLLLLLLFVFLPFLGLVSQHMEVPRLGV